MIANPLEFARRQFHTRGGSSPAPSSSLQAPLRALVPPERFESKAERVKRMMHEMEECERALMNTSLPLSEVERIGVTVHELAASIEKLLTSRVEEVAKRLLQRIMGTNPVRSELAKHFLLTVLSGARGSTLHAVAIEAVHAKCDTMWALGAAHFARTRARPGLEVLYATLKNKEERLDRRLLALQALSAGTEDGLGAVLRHCMLDEQPIIRRASIVALGDKRREDAVPELIRRLADTDPGVRDAAAEELQKCRGPLATEGVIPYLSAPEPLLRRVAIRGLRIESSSPFVDRVAVLLRDPQRLVQYEAAAALLGSGNEVWGGRILAAMSRLRPLEIGEIAKRLRPSNSRTASLFLTRALTLSDFDVRMDAAERASDFPDPEVVEAMVAMLPKEIWIGQETILKTLSHVRRCSPTAVDAALAKFKVGNDEELAPLWIAASKTTQNAELRARLVAHALKHPGAKAQVIDALQGPLSADEEVFIASGLADDSREVRTRSAIALVCWGSREGRDFILRQPIDLELNMILRQASWELAEGLPERAEDLVALFERVWEIGSSAHRKVGAGLDPTVLAKFFRVAGVTG